MKEIVIILEEHEIDVKDIKVRIGNVYDWYTYKKATLFHANKNLNIENLDFKDINPAGNDEPEFKKQYLEGLLVVLKLK